MAHHWPTGNSGRGCGGAPAPGRGATELLVPGDDRGRVAERQRAGEMDRVVTAQAMLLRHVARRSRKRHVDADQEQLILDRLEILDRLRASRRREPATALSGGEGGASLRVGEDARRRRVPRLP